MLNVCSTPRSNEVIPTSFNKFLKRTLNNKQLIITTINAAESLLQGDSEVQKSLIMIQFQIQLS